MSISESLLPQLDQQVRTGYFYLEGDRYIPWFAKDDEAFGFEFCLDEFAGVFVYVKKEDLKIENGKLRIVYNVLKNPNKLSTQIFSSPRFIALVEENINDILTKVSDWETKQKEKMQ